MNRIITLLLMVLGAAFAVSSAHAQTNYPNRPVRMVVTFPPGGSTDLIARIISPPLSERLGKAVVVENRPGASGAIGAEVAAKAAPDGHVLLIAGSSSVMGLNSVLIKNLPYDPRELAPITLLVTSPFIIAVNPAMLPAGSVKELLALLKSKPRQLSFGSGGNFSGMHLAGEYFKSLFAMDLQHIPYKGNGPALSDLSGGQIPVAFTDLGSTGPFVKSGRIKILAVASKERTPLAPDVPTTAEAGLPAWEALGSFGLITTAGTPQEVITRLNAEVTRILRLPDVRDRILVTGNEPAPTSPEEFSNFIKSEVVKWTRVIRESGIKFEQ